LPPPVVERRNRAWHDPRGLLPAVPLGESLFRMVARVRTVAFQGVDVLSVDVQVQMTGGLPAFAIVGLPDKSVAASKERVRRALPAIGLALPGKGIIFILAPADLAKEGTHFDLPIALALLIALGALKEDDIARHVCLGELGLDGSLAGVSGVLP